VITVAAVVVTRNRPALLKQCLEAIDAIVPPAPRPTGLQPSPTQYCNKIHRGRKQNRRTDVLILVPGHVLAEANGHHGDRVCCRRPSGRTGLETATGEDPWTATMEVTSTLPRRGPCRPSHPPTERSPSSWREGSSHATGIHGVSSSRPQVFPSEPPPPVGPASGRQR
jgi:hypothetical protein